MLHIFHTPELVVYFPDRAEEEVSRVMELLQDLKASSLDGTSHPNKEKP
jgi:hypothetical protein